MRELPFWSSVSRQPGWRANEALSSGQEVRIVPSVSWVVANTRMAFYPDSATIASVEARTGERCGLKERLDLLNCVHATE